MEKRIKIALEFLKDGHYFSVGDIRLGVKESNIVEVTGWSKYTKSTDLSKDKCLKELSELKDLFASMVDSSKDLSEFIENKSLEFSFFYDDDEKGSTAVCSERYGVVSWDMDLK